jgi:hypothetical protein
VSEYEGKQFVGIDLHRFRSVIVLQTATGEQLEAVRISNDPMRLAEEIGKAGSAPEVVLEGPPAGAAGVGAASGQAGRAAQRAEGETPTAHQVGMRLSLRS